VSQRDLFDHQAAAQEWPEWFRPSKHAPTQARNVARGLHPLGTALGDASSTCGGCLHLVKRGKFLKCARTKMSRCSASDVRAKWRACPQFLAKASRQV